MRKYAQKKAVYYHILLWILYFGINTLRWGSFFDDYLYSFQSNLVEFSVHLVLVYFNLYYLMPKLLPKSGKLYLFSLFSSALIMTFVRIIATYYCVTKDVYREAARSDLSIFDINYIIAGFIGQLYVIGFTTAIKVTIDYSKNLKRTKELEKERLKNELTFLKAQLQPHFFFNTLNSLYALVLEKSDKAPEIIIKLSEFMSYVLYSGRKRLVPIHEEVNYIQNYIELERLRFGKDLKIDFTVSDTVNGYKIPPLVLLPFVENAFKHGDTTKTLEPFLEMQISLIKNQMSFCCKNTLKQSNYVDLSDPIGGIGLANSKRRLNLLYPNRHTLNTSVTKEFYIVNLQIPLNSKSTRKGLTKENG